MNGAIKLIYFVIGFTLALAGTVGCRSTQPTDSGGFASVVIPGNTPGQIRDVAVEVFRNHGYSAEKKDPGNLIFEKEGSGMNNFAYGNWLTDSKVWIRVKAAIVPVGEMTARLECRAYIVRDRAGSTEEELPVSRLHSGQYQKLLNEVAKAFAEKRTFLPGRGVHAASRWTMMVVSNWEIF